MSRSHIVPSIQPMHFLFASHQLDQPFLRYGQNSGEVDASETNWKHKVTPDQGDLNRIVESFSDVNKIIRIILRVLTVWLHPSQHVCTYAFSAWSITSFTEFSRIYNTLYYCINKPKNEYLPYRLVKYIEYEHKSRKRPRILITRSPK